MATTVTELLLEGRGQFPHFAVTAPTTRGRGLGSRLVSTQLEGLAPGTAVYLTTIESRLRFYKRLGFKRLLLEEAPRWAAWSVEQFHRHQVTKRIGVAGGPVSRRWPLCAGGARHLTRRGEDPVNPETKRR